MIGRRSARLKVSSQKPKRWRTEIDDADQDDEHVFSQIDIPESSDEETNENRHHMTQRSRSRSRSSRHRRSDQLDSKHPVVPFRDIHTMSQCISAIDDLLTRISKASAGELLEACAACKRTGCFNATFFIEFNRIVPDHIIGNQYSVDNIIVILDVLKSLNVVDEHVFDVGLGVLWNRRTDLVHLRDEIKHLFALTHQGDSRLEDVLRTQAPVQRRKVCQSYFRGQCKWGSRCKYSHDQASFDESVAYLDWFKIVYIYIYI